MINKYGIASVKMFAVWAHVVSQKTRKTTCLPKMQIPTLGYRTDQKMKRTYKFRIYPTKDQEAALSYWIDTCRVLYNDCITERRDAWKQCRKSISYYDQANQLSEIKKFDDDLRSVHSQVIQDVLRRVDKAYQNFYRRVRNGDRKAGFPRYKGKTRYDSFTYPQSGFVIDENKLTLSKIGDIKIRQHREIEGNIKTCTIKRDVDQWYVCFSAELPDAPMKEKIESAVGIDLGLTSIITTDTGEKVDPPKHLRKSEEKLSREQRRLSRKVKGSNNRRKQKRIVGRVHRKIRNQRTDFNHKLSRDLVNNNDLIAFEDLSIKNMTQNHRLAKSISDAGWYQLQRFTAYKAEEAGKYVVFVDPNGTSIECNVCGYRVEKTLTTRVHRCPECGLIEDRDVNAAKNILKRGYDCLPQELREVTPVEMFVGTSMKQEAPLLVGGSSPPCQR